MEMAIGFEAFELETGRTKNRDSGSFWGLWIDEEKTPFLVRSLMDHGSDNIRHPLYVYSRTRLTGVLSRLVFVLSSLLSAKVQPKQQSQARIVAPIPTPV